MDPSEFETDQAILVFPLHAWYIIDFRFITTAIFMNIAFVIKETLLHVLIQI